MPGGFKSRPGFFSIFRLHQDIIRIVGGHNKDADSGIRQNGGNIGQDPDERKIQWTVDPERFPAILPG